MGKVSSAAFKKMLSVLLLLAIIALCAGCGAKNEKIEQVPESAPVLDTDEKQDAQEVIEESTESKASVYIVYTNDVHSYIYNTLKNDDGEEISGLRMSNVAAFVQDMRAEGKNVLLVDAGDEIQGDVYGAYDEGESIIKLMNACGYQLATLGNHEFDYGTFTLFKRVEEADYPYISCNFRSLEKDELPFAPSHIFEMGDCKIAFVGISTPETITSSTPIYFQNDNGDYIYTVDGIKDKNDLYESVQKAIDSVRDEADYVIALGHLGIGFESIRNGISSYDVIANVAGLDAFIDAHSHSVVEGDKIADKEGKEVILTQTGSYLQSIGLMQLEAGVVSTSLISEYDNSVETVATMENEIHEKIMAEMGEKLGVLETPLYIYNPEEPSARYIRSCEMNAGDFVADSTYWYFNDKMEIQCDAVLVNGGGVRAQLDTGDITYLDVKSVQPFGNMICLIEASGQDIIDALEMGVNVLGDWDDELNIPAENGGFMHVAGIKFEVDTTIPSGLKTDGEGMFESVEGEYRVKNVMVYDRAMGEYVTLEPDKMYRVGGINYLLRNSGGGLGMFAKREAIVDFVDLDYVITAEYIKSFAEENGEIYINTKNSPLSKLDGYLIDYENPFGAGRVVSK